MQQRPYVYLLASKRNGTLYVGATSSLAQRVWEHKEHPVEGGTGKYRVTNLVRYELHDTMQSAIRREKAIQNGKREWKIGVIESTDPQWRDLSDELL